MGKKATKKEIQDRVDFIIALMAEGVRSSDILQNATVNGWGVQERQIWEYIDRALTHFKDSSNIDRDSELGRILERYEVIFRQAFSDKDYRLCVTILDKRADLIGLKTYSLNLKAKEPIEHNINVIYTAVPRPPENEEKEEAPEDKGEEPESE